MSARVQLLCGPSGSGKTQRLLDLLRQHTQSLPDRVLWLGPTPRAVGAIRRRLAQTNDTAAQSRLYPFSLFFDEIIRCNDPSIGSLSPVQQRLFADELTHRLSRNGRLSYFCEVLETRGFQAGLLQLIAELKRQRVSPRRLADAFQRYRGGANLPDATARPVVGVTAKDRDCIKLFAHYLRELRDQKLLDLEGRPEHSLRLVRQGSWEPFTQVSIVLVDGFSDFTECQYRALQLLADRTDEIWIALPDERDDVRVELFSTSRAARQRLERCMQAEITWLDSLVHPSLPSGLAHLERQLFRPPAQVTTSDAADGIICLEAPGPVGEARMVARQIKRLLLNGVQADQVIVCLREVAAHAELLQEVFEEYGLPLDVEGSKPLTHNPAVALLLRVVRLPDEDWPFAGVTALLRNTYFRPSWPEVQANPEIAQQAEVLLRLLSEPRGRDAYLGAVRRWAEQQQPGLEDEEAEESRRRRTHQLAQRCLPFLERFFQAWNHAPNRAPLADHVRWLRNLTDDLGITNAANEDGQDRAALADLWQEVDAWQERSKDRRLDRKTFHRRLTSIASAAGLPRTPRGPGRLRILSAESARHLEVDHLFLMGLGERSFPRLTVPNALLDDHERQSLKRAGIELPGTADPFPLEMLLFYQLVTRPCRSLTLSYAAVDDRGQPLLPSSFLTSLKDCFAPNVVTVERRGMLIEGLQRDVPLSPAEYRTQLAAHGPDALAADQALPTDLRANLVDASRLIRQRFQQKSYSPYDGMLRDPTILAELAQRFDSRCILSPTALEDYISCPFRYFLGNVLRLEPLDQPREEIEMTRRGQAVHRAMARLHRRLRTQELHLPDESVDAEVAREMETAIQEDIGRAAGPAAKRLWSLEGQRLLRQTAGYREHWHKFIDSWRTHGIGPRPHFFEVAFGLPPTDDGNPCHEPLVIRSESLEVRISGRIDRVDTVDLPDGSIGFWIIDYKTGKSDYYTGTDLSKFRRLQLTLYALAVQEVLFAGLPARPLGLAYWMVTDTGAKVVLPSRNGTLWLTESKHWRLVRSHLESLIIDLVQHMRGGEFPLHPRDLDCSQNCDYGQVCRIAQSRWVEKDWSFSLPILTQSQEPAAS